MLLCSPPRPRQRRGSLTRQDPNPQQGLEAAMGPRELIAEELSAARPTAAATEMGAAAAPAARGSSWRRNRKRRASSALPPPALRLSSGRPGPAARAPYRARVALRPARPRRRGCSLRSLPGGCFLSVGGRKEPRCSGVLSSLEETPVAVGVLGTLAEIVNLSPEEKVEGRFWIPYACGL